MKVKEIKNVFVRDGVLHVYFQTSNKPDVPEIKAFGAKYGKVDKAEVTKDKNHWGEYYSVALQVKV